MRKSVTDEFSAVYINLRGNARTAGKRAARKRHHLPKRTSTPIAIVVLVKNRKLPGAATTTSATT